MASHSFQELDVRVKGIEDMLLFLMTATRMRAQVPTGLVGEDGVPISKWVEGTMLDFYKAARGAGMEMDNRGE